MILMSIFNIPILIPVGYSKEPEARRPHTPLSQLSQGPVSMGLRWLNGNTTEILPNVEHQKHNGEADIRYPISLPSNRIPFAVDENIEYTGCLLKVIRIDTLLLTAWASSFQCYQRIGEFIRGGFIVCRYIEGTDRGHARYICRRWDT